MLTFNNQTSQSVDKCLFEKALEVTVSELCLDKISVELTLVDDQKIKRLNNKFAQNDYVTDVLSWAYSESSNIFDHEQLGEVVISVQTANRQAEDKGHSLEYELAWLFVHGLLHILGYDHQDQAATIAMDQQTLAIVNQLELV